MLRILLALALSLFGLTTPALAALNVVATLPWIGSLVTDIGKDKVKVTTLVKTNQDPHYVEAKPSLIVEARRADILFFNGLDLEVGYLPILIESSRNPKIQPGTPGYFDCSQFVTPIERATQVDRSMGDVHPLGNPHYHLSPKNIFRVAEGISGGLARVDPANKDFYRANFSSFAEKFQEKQKQWSDRNLRGKKFLPYHKFFEYLAAEFGFEIIDYIEPKPGIPPSAGHVEKLIELMKKTKPDAILTTSYYGTKEVSFLSQKTVIKYKVVSHDVGATEKCKDWFSLIDQVLIALE
jgi:zinc/manganese transport system substrate-binding protein